MLDATQRRFAALLTAPDGVGAALREAGDAQGASLAGFVAGDARLDATSRLEVYANAYFARILDVLTQDFGALAAALGREGMNDVATAYLLAHPSRHFSIRHVGARLAAYLADDPRAAPLRVRWPWCADLARLETALGDAFDAADVPLLSREALAALPPDAWPDLRLHFAPCVRLLRLAWPVRTLREAFERDATPPPLVTPAPETLLVWRRDESVRWRAILPLEAELLEAALAGAPFEALCATAAGALGEAAAPGYAAESLARWVHDALLAAQ